MSEAKPTEIEIAEDHLADVFLQGSNNINKIREEIHRILSGVNGLLNYGEVKPLENRPFRLQSGPITWELKIRSLGLGRDSGHYLFEYQAFVANPEFLAFKFDPSAAQKHHANVNYLPEVRQSLNDLLKQMALKFPRLQERLQPICRAASWRT